MPEAKTDRPTAPVNHARNWLQVAGAAAVAAPSPILRTLEITGLVEIHLDPAVESLIFGISIMAAATLLVWASEVAEQLVSATLALAVLAIIAVLPEYAVDLYFAWQAPNDPEAGRLALANMTGANRLLIGLAWPLVFFLFWFKTRKTELSVGKTNAIGLIFLAVAALYSFSIPFKESLSLIDSAVLISLFGLYLVMSSRSPPSEHALMGPALSIAALTPRFKWAAVIGIFVYAAGVVFAAAEPFANGLVETGESFGIDEFLLVQWVAPLASESPEFILAALLALRGRAGAAMTLLIASKVNQWTLLVGSLPIAFSISGGTLDALPVEGRQAHEVFLTAAQSLFAVAVLWNLRFNVREALLIFVLFSIQLAIPIDEVRVGFGFMYIVLAIVWTIRERKGILPLFRYARAAASGKVVAADSGQGEH